MKKHSIEKKVISWRITNFHRLISVARKSIPKWESEIKKLERDRRKLRVKP